MAELEVMAPVLSTLPAVTLPVVVNLVADTPLATVIEATSTRLVAGWPTGVTVNVNSEPCAVVV